MKPLLWPPPRGLNDPELQQHRQILAGRPVLHQLVARDSEPVALMGGESLPSGRQCAIERSEVCPLRQNPACHGIPLRYERLDRHLQIRELGQQPFGDSPHMLWPIDPTGSRLSERSNSMLDVRLRNRLVAGGQVPAVEDLLEVPPN